MAARSFSTMAAIGLLVSWPAYADPAGGDIVDQILRSNAQPGAVLPPPAEETPAASTIVGPDIGAPAPAAPVFAGSPTPTPAPAALAPPPPGSPTPLNPSAALAPPPAAAPAPMPVATIEGPDIIGLPPGASPGTPDAVPAAPLPLLSEPGRWQGFYVGGNFGGGWTTGGSGDTCLNSVTNTTSGCIVLGKGALDTSGVFGGVQLGYLTPVSLGEGWPTLVIGGEADVQGSGISGQQNASPPLALIGFAPCTDCSFHASQSLNWFGTLRARIGLPVDNLLFYGTGGLIVGGLETRQSINFAGGTGNYGGSTSSTKVGPVVGGGIELLTPGPWSVKLEALYYDLGHVRNVAEPLTGAAVNFSDTKNFGFRGALVRLGVDFRLGDIGF